MKKFDYLQTQKAQKELKIIHKFSISLRHAHALSEVENTIRFPARQVSFFHRIALKTKG